MFKADTKTFNMKNMIPKNCFGIFLSAVIKFEKFNVNGCLKQLSFLSTLIFLLTIL